MRYKYLAKIIVQHIMIVLYFQKNKLLIATYIKNII